MNTVSLRAHFDGEAIRLDEPYDLKPDSELIVTVLPTCVREPDSGDWLRLSGTWLEAAYGPDEPDYTMDMVKEANPAYEAG